MELLAIFKSGGVIMYPLLVLFIVTLLIIYVSFRQIKNFVITYTGFFLDYSKCKEQNNLSKLMAKYEIEDKSIQTYCMKFLTTKKLAKREKNEIERFLHGYLSKNKRYQWILATVASVAPFLGLFGTVTGIMLSFSSISIAGKSNFVIVSEGLSEALVSTAAGILVGIIALLFHNYFANRVKIENMRFVHRLEDLNVTNDKVC